ncbi:hypothetical protein C5167_005996 [Papaver somniferum]|uniref:Uncharacterized protein n=1 Tax=Papaver somniferum TaxID=3469 RepID=A0A4Y7JD09_PAPSO|nr:hypothetical protein C5167_005996 [Papaver somniferum]
MFLQPLLLAINTFRDMDNFGESTTYWWCKRLIVYIAVAH